MKCPKCRSEDIDLSLDFKHLYQCQECGRQFTPRTTKKPRVVRYSLIRDKTGKIVSIPVGYR